MAHLSQVVSLLMLKCVLLCIEDTLPFNGKECSKDVMYANVYLTCFKAV